MIKKILLGYDGSDSAKKALDAALDLARTYQAELYVLTVAQPPDFGEDVETEAIIENSRSYHQRALAPVKHIVGKSGVRAVYEVAVGHAAEQIIFHADRYQVDLIVLGHRGKSLFRRLLLGSVSKQVVQYADRTVLVVR